MCITRYRLHYIEYLVGLIGKHKVDPISILDLVEVTQELRRRGRAIADRPAGHSEYQYRVMLSKVSYRDKSSNLQKKKKKEIKRYGPRKREITQMGSALLLRKLPSLRF